MFIVGSSLALAGCTQDEGGDDDGGGGGHGGIWRVITPAVGQDSNPVLSVYCTSSTKCVVGTGDSAARDAGALFSASDTAIGEKLLDGDSDELIRAIGDNISLDFIGIEPTNNAVVARLSDARAFLAATGDITEKASWRAVSMGLVDGRRFDLSEQGQLQIDAAGNAVYITKQGAVYTASRPPGETTEWIRRWSPLAVPPVPEGFEERHRIDPTLCEADVSAGGLPTRLNPDWIAPDLSVVVLPAASLNDRGTEAPGVCISTDKGVTFFHTAFSIPSGTDQGPQGVTCIDKDRCFAYGGLPFQRGSAYIQYTSNASAGKASTWTAATVPDSWATSDAIVLQGMFFAPDGVHGWAVGSDARKSLLMRTTDGGRTWTDVSASVRAALSNANDLLAGFALDKDHIWIGGKFGALLSTDSAQE